MYVTGRTESRLALSGTEKMYPIGCYAIVQYSFDGKEFLTRRPAIIAKVISKFYGQMAIQYAKAKSRKLDVLGVVEQSIAR